MKRRIFSILTAMVLIFTMAIPAFAANSYFYEGTYDDVAYQFTASCSSGYAYASTGYANTSRTVSTILKVTLTNGDKLTYETSERTIQAMVEYSNGNGAIKEAWCQFTVTGAITKAVTLKAT